MSTTRTLLTSPALYYAVLVLLSPSICSAAPPNFVPRDWKRVDAQSNRNAVQFRSPDGQAALIMRDLRASAVSPLEVIQPRRGEEVTYRARRQDWWVLSGYRGDDIFYRRASFACDHRRIHVIELAYPRYLKRQFDPIVTSISHRLEGYRDVCPKGTSSR